ncbi:MAG: cell division/cell wall cluster transcriptional repressor MraZ [Armatimonadota bacterium]|nr:cell division/cell wall cluster transcriptional repressor MraZ [Armatimonadota bacterium]
MLKTEMLYGFSENTLDPNGRVIIPRKMRMQLGEPFYMARGYEKCVRIFTEDTLHAIKAYADQLGTPLSVLFDPDALRVYRQVFSHVDETKTDGQGRVLIPPRLREYAEIKDNVVLVGTGNWIEIWNPENWKEYEERELTEEKLTGAGGNIFKDPSAVIRSGGDAGVSQTGPAE